MRRPEDDDATVVMRPAAVSPPRRPGRRAAMVAAAAGLLVVAGGLAWMLRPPAAPRAPVPPAVSVPASPAAPAFAIATADEAAIAADVPAHLMLFRFAEAPAVLVLDFASLAEQGAMLNRVAALVEKAGLPRDRVLTDAELDAAIRASGDTAGTFYYGHDYPAADLVRFFALAEANHVKLDAQEERLRALLRQLGWFDVAAPVGALISIPRTGASAEIDQAARAAMLHHELSHGVFFTDPAYAAYVHGFWRTALTETERDAMRRFLGDEGYDTTDETLMLNEMQAYVMFTDDARFFQPANIGITAARRAELRAVFAQGAPPGWPRTTLLAAAGR